MPPTRQTRQPCSAMDMAHQGIKPSELKMDMDDHHILVDTRHDALVGGHLQPNRTIWHNWTKVDMVIQCSPRGTVQYCKPLYFAVLDMPALRIQGCAARYDGVPSYPRHKIAYTSAKS